MKLPKFPNVRKMFTNLCNPAKLYLLLTLVSVCMYMITLNTYNEKLHSVHEMGVDSSSHTYMGVIMQVVWAILWTSVLNYICHKFPKHGTAISWALVLMPFILFFIFFFFGLFLLSHVMATASSHQSMAGSLLNNFGELSDKLKMVHGNVVDHGNTLEDVHEVTRSNRDTLESLHETSVDHKDALNALHKPSHPIVEHDGHDPQKDQHAHHESHGDSLFGF